MADCQERFRAPASETPANALLAAVPRAPHTRSPRGAPALPLPLQSPPTRLRHPGIVHRGGWTSFQSAQNPLAFVDDDRIGCESRVVVSEVHLVPRRAASRL